MAGFSCLFIEIIFDDWHERVGGVANSAQLLDFNVLILAAGRSLQLRPHVHAITTVRQLILDD